MSICLVSITRERDIVQIYQSEGNIDKACRQHYLLGQGKLLCNIAMGVFAHFWLSITTQRGAVLMTSLIFAFGSKGY